MTTPRPSVLLAAALLLTACSATVTRPEGPQAFKPGDRTYENLTVELTPEARKQLAENIKFNPDTLATTVRRTLEARSLLAAGSDHRLAVSVKDIRVRSTVNAILWGFMASNDHVHGDVSVLDRAGRAVYTYEVRAAYALGGIAGGDDARMTWLYEKFSELTAKELVGEGAR